MICVQIELEFYSMFDFDELLESRGPVYFIERTLKVRTNLETRRLEIITGTRVLELDREHAAAFLVAVQESYDILNKIWETEHPIDPAKERVFLKGLIERAKKVQQVYQHRMSGN